MVYTYSKCIVKMGGGGGESVLTTAGGFTTFSGHLRTARSPQEHRHPAVHVGHAAEWYRVQDQHVT